MKFSNVKEVEQFLKNNGVDEVTLSYSDEDDVRFTSYCISSVEVLRSWRTGTKGKVRVYFRKDSKRNTFIQSDINGNFDNDTFLAKAKSYLEDEQTRQDFIFAKDNESQRKNIVAKNMTKKLANLGFRVSVGYLGYEIKANVYNDEELKKLVSKLINK